MRLRAQWALVSLFLPLYAAGVGLAYGLQARAHARLEESFQRDLGALLTLPRLRDGLRRLDLLTDQYLRTGNPSDLEARRAALEEVRRSQESLAPLAGGVEERELIGRMGRELSAVLAEQGQWIARRREARLPPAEAARLAARRDSVGELLALLLRMKDANLDRLSARRREAEAAGRATLALIVSVGLAAGLFVALYLSWYLVEPVAALSAYARGWTLGRPWELPAPRASQEVADLYGRLGEMGGRLAGQYEKEQELGRFKTQLVAMVSHEFNNALNILGGIALLLRTGEKPPLEERRNHYYQILTTHLRGLGLAARNLLEMGRMESGRFVVRARRMDLAASARECASRLEVLWERKGLAMALELPASPAWVEADPEALALVVTNLLGNAVKYTPEGGRVTLGVRPAPGEAEGRAAPGDAGRFELYVADTGIGIPKEEQDRILSGYHRTEAGQKAAKGFGVGLALAASLLQAHKTSLAVESEPGKGARFSFALPAAGEEPAAEA